MPNIGAKIRSAKALWIYKGMRTKKPWAKALREPGIDWTTETALTTPRLNHGISGFLGECVTEWYRSVTLLKGTDNAYIWPYIKNVELSRIIMRKCPKLTFSEAKEEKYGNLNFLERARLKAAMKHAEHTLMKTWNWIGYEGKHTLQKNLNCMKWSKPKYDKEDKQVPIGEGKVKNFMLWLDEQLAGIESSSLSTQRSIYWLHVQHIIPTTHPFRSRMDIEFGPIKWNWVDKTKISVYSKLQSFIWRSTHGKLYGNKDYFRMGVKQTSKCAYCDEEQQTVDHLYINCARFQKLFSCFEKQYNLTEKLTTMEKRIGIDTNIKRSKIILKKLNILRRAMHNFNHKDEILRWGTYLEMIENIYTIEYAIADRNDRVLQHLQHWEA